VTQADTELHSEPRLGIHRRMYNWVLSWANTRYAIPALILISMIESSIFPIPPDVLLIALVLGCPGKWYKFAFYCTIASVIGGMIGYGIGWAAWESLGIVIVENIVGITMVTVDGRQDIALPPYMIAAMGESLGGAYLFQVYDYWNAWIVFIFGLTPLPYKLVTVTAGMARIDFGIFVLASIFARGLRFFMVAYILKVAGPPAKVIIDRHFNVLCIAFVLLLIGGFAVLKLIL